MKKPQYIIAASGIVLLILILVFGRTANKPAMAADHAGHNHEQEGDRPTTQISVDSLLANSKKSLTTEQATRLSLLENSITRGDVKKQQLDVYHQLTHFWRDTGKSFIPYAWYNAESARLENSEKNLTFAGHLFLDRVQFEENPAIKKWMALQAKDLFERSLSLNPGNDSSKVALGAAYLFGGISQNPMEGLAKIRDVITKDSTNIYAQMTMATASLMSGQTDKARERLETVVRLQPDNIQALLMLGDMFEKQGDKTNAIHWYSKALHHINRADIKQELERRIADLKK